jgi:hypothetical protein
MSQERLNILAILLSIEKEMLGRKKKIEYKNLMNNFAFQKVRRIIFLIKK